MIDGEAAGRLLIPFTCRGTKLLDAMKYQAEPVVVDILSTEHSMGIDCKKYMRWDAMKCSLIDKAFQAWNSSNWFARRHFKESKLRDEVDVMVYGIEIWFCLKILSDEIHPAQRKIITYSY